jgi:class 3 adenylate cyclase
LPQTKEDTNKVNTLIKLSREYRIVSEYSKGLDFGEQALGIAQQINFLKGEVQARNIIGLIFISQGNYSSALDMFNKLLNSIPSDSGRIATWAIIISNAYTNIGLIYDGQYDYPKALEMYLKSLKIKEAISAKQPKNISIKQSIANVNNNLGNLYKDQKDYTKAMEAYSHSIKIYEAINIEQPNNTSNKQGLSNTYNNIGLVYRDQSKNMAALEMYFKSLKMSEVLGDKHGISSTYTAIGGLYIDLFIEDSLGVGFDFKPNSSLNENENQIAPFHISHNALLDSALLLHERALSLDLETGDKNNNTYSLYGIGQVYFNQKKYKEAISYYKQSYAISDSINALDGKRHNANRLSECYKGLKKYDKALSWYEKSVIIKDTIFNQEKHKELTRKTMNYEFDKKEAITKTENEKKLILSAQALSKQTMFRNGFMGGFAVVILFAGVFFRQRNKISKAKKRSDELLLNILPAEVAEELKINGESEARQFDDVTVLLTDFVNFTGASEKLTPKELVSEIHHCFTAFDEIIGRNGLEKIKTTGDAYLAVCGLPNADGQHAKRAIIAAKEILKFMDERKNSSLLKGGFGDVKIGIHSGSVVAGIVGVKKFAYDIWGDTVNTAARMEQNCDEGKINISGSTYQLAKNDFNFIYRGKIKAKNKGEIDMYFVEN